NYGTCTLPEGRMVTKALLEGSISGVGKYHKTPIFPCGIFQCKEGVNRREGDPNYDLFRMALKSTAQRIYPNYANGDAPMQKAWVKYDRDMKERVIGELSDNDKGKLISRLNENKALCDKLFLDVVDGKLKIQQEEKPYEIFSTMGCVGGEETILYHIEGDTSPRRETFAEAWDRISKLFPAQEQIEGVKDHLFITPKGIKVFDTKNGYVEVYTIIRNTSDNWMRLITESGHTLRCTTDHPLPTNKGRVFAADLVVGDMLTVTDSNGKEYQSPISVIDQLERTAYSYDVETSSDHFEVSNIWSHNCRTVNGADINAEISYRDNIKSVIEKGELVDDILSAAQKDGRGNICPVTIILPTLAMEADRDKTKFMKLLDKRIHDAKDSLIERFEWIASQNPKSAKFMWENSTMSGYREDEGPRSALRHGTVVIGQLGLAEALQLLIGKDHTTDEGMELAKEIEGLFQKRCAEFKEESKLNFGVYYTPAENLCHTAMKKFKGKYGIIENVSDREYFTNSIHVPVWKEMTPFEKIDIESQLVGYSSAGCITYVELDSGVKHNVEAMEQIVNYAMDKDIPYFAINVPIDDCNNCGYSDEIDDVCPECGSDDISRLRRITGYLSGDYKSAFNVGKQHETEDRVKHIREVVE
ncbi:MAG: DUF3029 family protein, partial [Bacteroidales bacterium]|nr:DUF3029 family protein [Bacteroidales bacterium]